MDLTLRGKRIVGYSELLEYSDYRTMYYESLIRKYGRQRRSNPKPFSKRTTTNTRNPTNQAR